MATPCQLHYKAKKQEARPGRCSSEICKDTEPLPLPNEKVLY